TDPYRKKRAAARRSRGAPAQPEVRPRALGEDLDATERLESSLPQVGGVVSEGRFAANLLGCPLHDPREEQRVPSVGQQLCDVGQGRGHGRLLSWIGPVAAVPLAVDGGSLLGPGRRRGAKGGGGCRGRSVSAPPCTVDFTGSARSGAAVRRSRRRGRVPAR